MCECSGSAMVPYNDAQASIKSSLLARGKKTPIANDYQVGGGHYRTTGLQHWDLVQMFEWDYFQGQVIKYLMRWRKKNGIEDLEKARHYLDKYIEIQRSKTVPEKDTGVSGNIATNRAGQDPNANEVGRY